MKKNLLLFCASLFFICLNANADRYQSIILKPYANGSDESYYSFYDHAQQERNATFYFSWGSRLSFARSASTGSYGLIADLGAMSCKDIKNSYETAGSGYPTKEDRQNNPFVWFNYSDAGDALRSSNSYSNIKLHGDAIEVKEGHCYVVRQDTYSMIPENIPGMSVIGVFHVKKVIPDVSIEINEIEVFKRAMTMEQT